MVGHQKEHTADKKDISDLHSFLIGDLWRIISCLAQLALGSGNKTAVYVCFTESNDLSTAAGVICLMKMLIFRL